MHTGPIRHHRGVKPTASHIACRLWSHHDDSEYDDERKYQEAGYHDFRAQSRSPKILSVPSVKTIQNITIMTIGRVHGPKLVWKLELKIDPQILIGSRQSMHQHHADLAKNQFSDLLAHKLIQYKSHPLSLCLG